MENLSAEYLFRAEAWLLITTLIYFIMNGAGIFETTVIIPKWTASPPESLQIFKGEYGIDVKIFWIAMHSIHEITFIVAIVFCWHIPGIREAMLALFAVHFGVRAWTLTYFAPTIMEFQKVANGGTVVADIAGRAKRWKNLNYVRTGLFIAVSVGVLAIFLNVLRMMF
jgi:hypothetical protein